MRINYFDPVPRTPVRARERLVSGVFVELPADVFVRGFLRSFAGCVGLTADDPIQRYPPCGLTPAPVSSPLAEELANAPAVAGRDERRQADASRRRTQAEGVQLVKGTHAASMRPEPVARVEQQAAQATTQQAQGTGGTGESSAIAASDQQSRRKRKRRKRKQGHDLVQASAPPSTRPCTAPAEAASAPVRAHTESAVQASQVADLAPSAPGDARPLAGRAATSTAAVGASRAAAQPLAARVHAQSQAVRPPPARRVRASTVTTRAVPVLVIDDDHPEEAALSQEQRVERSDASWRSFLPPSLLDSDDGSRRGTLTLAVIILVIVATLTMSYLRRRPTVSGDGVTWQAPISGEISSPRAHA
jgi:cytoskeletal protein RodZ